MHRLCDANDLGVSSMAQLIAKWLDGLGLGKYITAFAENDIDFRALPHLTEEDLKSLGFSLGHRRILLAALADLPSVANSRSYFRTSWGQPSWLTVWTRKISGS